MNIFSIILIACCMSSLKSDYCNADFSPYLMCCGQTQVFKPEKYSQCCGTKAYTPTKQVCCGGEVFKKTDINSGCCYNQYYQKGQKQCCGRQLVDLKSEGCCRNEPFNTAYEACCSGSRIPILTLNETECCGTTLIDPLNEICCAESSAPRLHGAFTKCCGSLPFDIRKEICCNKMVQLKVNNLDQCCNGKPIDTQKQICCGNHIRPLLYGNVHTGCCRINNSYAHIYNIKTHLCCSNKLSEKFGKESGCCLDKVYDLSTHLCCDGTLHKTTSMVSKRCCGDKVYDRERQLCCDNQLHTFEPHLMPNMYCCGKYKYDIRIWECKKDNKLSSRGFSPITGAN